MATYINEPIRGRRWLTLPRDDERSKSSQLPHSREQTYFNRFAKMGQGSSTNDLTGTKHSAKTEPTNQPKTF